MSIIVYSGGLDSTVLLYKLASEGKADAAISVNYGQRHSKELEYAAYNCKKLGIEYNVANLQSLQNLFGANSLTDSSCDVPNGHYQEDNMKTTVVPNRNMILIAIATARAIAIGCDSVAYAAHSGDHAIYPDCRNEFADALANVLKVCHYSPITLERPFVNMTKADIVKLGHELGVDFSKTWSCYNGAEHHCGTCGTCIERKEAFSLANIPDPTFYSS